MVEDAAVRRVLPASHKDTGSVATLQMRGEPAHKATVAGICRKVQSEDPEKVLVCIVAYQGQRIAARRLGESIKREFMESPCSRKHLQPGLCNHTPQPQLDLLRCFVRNIDHRIGTSVGWPQWSTHMARSAHTDLDRLTGERNGACLHLAVDGR